MTTTPGPSDTGLKQPSGASSHMDPETQEFLLRCWRGFCNTLFGMILMLGIILGTLHYGCDKSQHLLTPGVEYTCSMKTKKGNLTVRVSIGRSIL